MEANELRLNNWVNHCNKEVQITIHDLFDIVVFEDDVFTPIPLTEEWLLRFGFKKAPLVDKYLKGYFTYDSKLKYFTYFTDIEDGGYENIIIQKEKLKYVHQLQNLYFALIGEELVLKN